MREAATRSREAVAQLPEHMRKTVNLVYRDQLKYGEVAESLSVPLGTVKSRMNNALRRLRAIMAVPTPMAKVKATSNQGVTASVNVRMAKKVATDAIQTCMTIK